MRLIHPHIGRLFDTEQNVVETLVIENQRLFKMLLTDIYDQIQGLSGETVLSENDEVISFAKHVEILDRFVPFTLNQKSLLTKISASLEKIAVGAEYIDQSIKLIATLEQFFNKIAFESACDIVFTKLNISTLIKASSPELREDYENLGEKILDYMELLREYDKHKKLFITVNLRSYLSETETELFMQTVIQHQYHLLMLENHEYTRCKYERRFIVDKDLCEIG